MTATDTLRTAEILREAGVPDRQAAATARAIDLAVAESRGDLATRADLAEMETRLTRTLYRALLIQTGVIAGIVIALLRLLP